ncbi:uncharacterized protein [Cicer arietinum]|uniref:NDR1/HIN1-like protein 6 n=1 Tax=Cicer arietinum TaxID=3827 RepID=A0A1S2XUP1_CICAR|nr:NDR1/HIN1-like protein 6 [Cicer arietinum]
MMDSSNHGKSPPKESSTSDHQPSSNNDSSPPPQPPPVAAPHMMYYPPGTGYPSHGPQPPPYHPYPPPPHGYAPYPQGYNNYPGPAPYYNVPPNYNAANGGRGFFRGFIMCSCLIFTCFFLSSIIMALILHPQLPVYKVTSLSVTNFNTTPILTGDWNISITVQNPNDRLRGYFSDFKVDVVHENDELALSYVPDFELEKHEQKQMDVKTSSSNGAYGVSFQKWDLDKIANERQTGSVMFGVRVSSMTAFKSTSLSTRNAVILAVCEGLKVVFQTNTGTGTLDTGGNPVICQLYM